MAAEERLVKIVANLQGEESFAGESLWAKPLGNDLYELRSTPFSAHGLHFMDVVQAVAPSPDRIPEVVEVVRRSGHRTIRLVFAPQLSADGRSQLVRKLNEMHAYYERAGSGLYAFDVEPQGDYQAVRNQLDEWEKQGLLQYERGTTEQGRNDAGR
ncbi:MAG: DUF4265 domain-containing protein [Chloroflexota bacterium]|nr:DUF4265 domain-containing protein [Chloroflexota bacterium]